MFNDRYGLTAAVLQGRKTMTRRIVPTQYVPMIEDGLQGAALIEAQRHGDAYRENEVLAVAQAYINTFHPLDWVNREIYEKSKGWTNKMFVRPDLMPHQIQITDINIERLQDISDEDCLKEGVLRRRIRPFRTIKIMYQVPNTVIYKDTPRESFATLINRPGVGRPGLWEENPFVFAYSFQLIK